MDMVERVMLVVFGGILLLPGLCSVYVFASTPDRSGLHYLGVPLLWLVTFIIAIPGILLVRKGLSNMKSKRD